MGARPRWFLACLLLLGLVAPLLLVGCTVMVNQKRGDEDYYVDKDGNAHYHRHWEKQVIYIDIDKALIDALLKAGALIGLPAGVVPSAGTFTANGQTYRLDPSKVTDPDVKAKVDKLKAVVDQGKDDLWRFDLTPEALQALKATPLGSKVTFGLDFDLVTISGTTHIDVPLYVALDVTTPSGQQLGAGLDTGFVSGSLAKFTLPLDFAPLSPGLGSEDVADSFAVSQIYDLMRKGIVGPQFLPNAAIDRGTLAAWLSRGLRLSLTPKSQPTFSDVPLTHPYIAEVESVADARLMLGRGDGTFGAADALTREQAAVILVRALGKEADALALPSSAVDAQLAAFRDAASVDDYARAQIAFAVQNGLLKGYPDGTFQPLRAMSRAEVASVLSNLLKLRPPR